MFEFHVETMASIGIKGMLSAEIRSFSHGFSPFHSPIAAEFWSCEKESKKRKWQLRSIEAGWIYGRHFTYPFPEIQNPELKDAEETAANSQWTIAI